MGWIQAVKPQIFVCPLKFAKDSGEQGCEGPKCAWFRWVKGYESRQISDKHGFCGKAGRPETDPPNLD